MWYLLNIYVNVYCIYVVHIARQWRPIAVDGELKVSNLVFDWLKYFLGNTQILKQILKQIFNISLFDSIHSLHSAIYESRSKS